MNVIFKLVELEDFIQQLTTKMLGFDPSLPENQSKVRVSWQPSGAPAWRRDQDVIFIQINSSNDPITFQRDVSYEPMDTSNMDKLTSYTRVHDVRWICYGPNSYDNAETIKNGLFRQDIMEEYSEKNLHLVLDIPQQKRLMEEYNSQWWARADFNVSFNELVIVEDTTPFLDKANVTVFN